MVQSKKQERRPCQKRYPDKEIPPTSNVTLRQEASTKSAYKINKKGKSQWQSSRTKATAAKTTQLKNCRLTTSYWRSKLCKNLYGSGVFTSPYGIGTVPVKTLTCVFSGPKLAHLAVKKFVQFRRSGVNERWNRASFRPSKNSSGPV